MARCPLGKPWDRQPVSGKLRRKLGASPGFAEHTLARHLRESRGVAAHLQPPPPRMAENHQERCNPAIHLGAWPIIISHLRMAKDMHITTLTWYEGTYL